MQDLIVLFEAQSHRVMALWAFEFASESITKLEKKYPERKIALIDSKSASGGEGLLVLKAIRNRKKGMDIEPMLSAYPEVNEELKARVEKDQ